MRKKLLGIAIATAMAATLAACGGGSTASTSSASAKTESKSETKEESKAETKEESKAETKEESKAEEPAGSGAALQMDECEDTFMREHYEEFCGDESPEGKSVGFTLQSLGNDFMKYLSEGIRAAFEAQGCDISIDSCEGDSTRQVEIIENYITMGKDLIIIFPLNGESLVAVAGQAEDAGIPVVAFAMDVPNEKVTTHIISADESVMGAACGQMASDWADENLADQDTVEVLFIGSTTSPEMADRSDATEEALKANSRINVTRVDSPNSNDTNEGRNVTENSFQGGKYYDMVVACNSNTAIGVDSYIMSSDSPIPDLSKFAIFLVDETGEIDEAIINSLENKSAIRGTISMGDISDTVDVLLTSCMPILTGGNPVNHINGSAMPLDPETLLAKAEAQAE